MNGKSRKTAVWIYLFIFLFGIPLYAGQPESKIKRKRLGEYKTLFEVYQQIWSIADSRPDLVHLSKIGYSTDGFPIYLCVLGQDDGQKPAILYTANIHGNECVATHMALAILRHFVQNEGKDQRITRLIQDVSIWIVPMLNPDGYHDTVRQQLTYGTGLLFRKNASGVDLNRNFPHDPDYHSWDPRSGSNWLELSPNYRGEKPLSEPETMALQTGVLDKRTFDIALGFHTSGGLIVYPWGRQPEPCPDDALFREVALAYQSEQIHYPYRIHQQYKWYPVIGNINDYLYEKYGTLSYTIELGRPDPSNAPGMQKLSLFWVSNVRDLDREIENNLQACIRMAEWAEKLHNSR